MTIHFDKSPDGLLPAVIQDDQTGKVLMLGYMNREAYEKTQAEGIVTFFSRSKQRLWTKGETSSNFLHVRQILVDCDGDTLLIKASPDGPTCHTGADTCFEEVNQGRGQFLNYLQGIIHDRKVNPSDKSYTTSLFNRRQQDCPESRRGGGRTGNRSQRQQRRPFQGGSGRSAVSLPGVARTAKSVTRRYNCCSTEATRKLSATFTV